MFDALRQPIETAPRDGTPIRLYRDDDVSGYPAPVTGVWQDGVWHMLHGFVIEREGRQYWTQRPTHWAPLAPAAIAGTEVERPECSR